MACGILVPWPGIEPRPMAVKAPSPNHWSTRGFPKCDFNVGFFFFFKWRKGPTKSQCGPSGEDVLPNTTKSSLNHERFHPSVECSKIFRCWFFVSFLSSWVSWRTFSDNTTPVAVTASMLLTKTFQGPGQCKEVGQQEANKFCKLLLLLSQRTLFTCSCTEKESGTLPVIIPAFFKKKKMLLVMFKYK